jgi:hypothetical protein
MQRAACRLSHCQLVLALLHPDSLRYFLKELRGGPLARLVLFLEAGFFAKEGRFMPRMHNLARGHLIREATPHPARLQVSSDHRHGDTCSQD